MEADIHYWHRNSGYALFHTYVTAYLFQLLSFADYYFYVDFISNRSINTFLPNNSLFY